MCDVLGFKELLASTNLESIWRLYRDLISTVAVDTSSGRSGLLNTDDVEDYPVTWETQRAVFSDTLLLWSRPVDEYHSAAPFFRGLALLIGNALTTQTPLRVGIAYGECILDLDHDIYLGKPIADAYLTESAQEWIGAACHESCLAASDFDRLVEIGHIVEADIPVKAEHLAGRLGFTLGWPRYKEHKLEDMRALFKLGAEAAPSEVAKAKWGNTRRFFEEQLWAYQSERERDRGY